MKRAWAPTAVGSAIAVGGAAFVATRISDQWPEVRRSLEGAEWWWLVPATVLAAAGMGWVGWCWRACLRALGADAPHRAVLRWYFLGQLGKYLPGGLWPLLGRGEMATRGGVPRSTSYNSVALSMALTYLAASLTVILLLPFDRSGGAAGSRWVLVGVPLGLLVLHPRLLRGLLGLAERFLGAGTEPRIPPWASSVALIARHVPAWVAIGASTALIARALDPDAPLVQTALAGVFSWIIGFVAIPAPGGLGVREAAFIAVAAGLSPGVAATTAVVSRLVFMAVDATAAAAVVIASAGPRGWKTGSISGSDASAHGGLPADR